MFREQKTHPAQSWQVCLLHQLEDCHYGINAENKIFSQRMKMLLPQSFVLQGRCANLKQSTRYQYRCHLYQDLKSVLALSLTQEDGIRLQNCYLSLQKNLFLLLDDLTISPMNNTSERVFRWSVMLWKVVKDFRYNWGRDFLRRFSLLSILKDDRDLLSLMRF